MRLESGSAFLLRVALFAFIWWILSQGEPSSWWWGAPVVLLAAWMYPLFPGSSWRWHWRPLLRLLPHILLLSARGGLEVAVLALHPKQRLNTRLLNYRWHCLPEGPARLFMASLINLIPGTLTLRPLPDRAGLHVHILNYRSSTLTTLQHLEAAVAELYGLASSPKNEGAP